MNCQQDNTLSRRTHPKCAKLLLESSSVKTCKR
uniref:Uncharacterized protein n=1 Tax=Anguilla anguilla TaxID=7936 RepID=A0A0E9W8U4_ANGAN